MARDDFRTPVVTELRERVSGRCSNPACRVQTVAAKEEGAGVNRIGVAAHITAAAPGGPRFDGNLTATKRRGFDNGIWLCANCSVKIDRDVAKHTVDLLRSWKSSAEAAAVAELGKRLPSSQDTVDTVAAVLTAAGPRFIDGAVGNAAQASAKALETIDPRFAVNVTFDDAKTTFRMNARVDVPIELKIRGDEQVDLSAIRDALAHGEDVEVPMRAVEVAGSPLFVHATERGGKLRIEPHKVPIVARLSFTCRTGAKWKFDDVSGLGAIGASGVSFAGEACDGIVALDLRAEPGAPVSFNLHVRFTRWVGLDVRALPHWESVHELVARLVAGDALRVTFYRDGVRGSSGTATLNQPENMRALLWLFQHAAAAMVVAKVANVAVAFDRWQDVTPSDHRRLVEIADEIEHKSVRHAADLTGNPTLHLKLHEPTSDLAAMLGPGNFRIDEPEGEVVRVFGKPVRLPPRRTTFEAVEPRVQPTPHDDDRSFDVELVFTPRSSMRVEYAADGGADTGVG